MRTVIDHHVYDSDTACGVYRTRTEKLYRKRTGEYFLLNLNSDTITPLSYEQAQQWADENMHAEAFHREFSGTPTTSTPVRINIMLRADLYDRLENESRRTGRSKTAIITDALDAALS